MINDRLDVGDVCSYGSALEESCLVCVNDVFPPTFKEILFKKILVQGVHLS